MDHKIKSKLLLYQSYDFRLRTSRIPHIDNDGSSAWSQAVDAAVESGLVVTLSV